MTCAAANAREPERESPTPVWLPRAAWAGLFVGPGVIPQIRVLWLATIAQEQVNSLSLAVEGGGGYALGRPTVAVGTEGNIHTTFMYQHVALFGLAQRADRPSGFHWGVTILTGPVFFGSRFDGGLRKENKIVGTVEGRVQFGWKFDKVRVGVVGGVAQVYEYPPRVYSAVLLGGPLVGVFAEWR